jgi:hypothetical protein
LLDIPSTLLDKIKQAFQTVGTNADPKMDVIAQKAAKYLSQGSFLQPRTVRTGNSLGPLDICIRREDAQEEPTEIVMAYIQNGTARVATLPYVSRPDQSFVYKYNLGAADDIACDFDGRWQLITDHTGIYFDTETIWALETFGEPYIAIVNDGDLSIRIAHGTPLTIATDVTKCSVLRGWKSAVEVLTEQWVLCTYIKTDGKVYYRAYCEQEDGSFNWEVQREITDFPSPVTNISMFRTADYRTGFLAEIVGEINMMVTKRCWSGMALIPEFVELTDATALGELFDIIYWEAQSGDEYVEVEGVSDAIQYANYSPTIVRAWNIATNMEDPENPEEYYDDYGYRIVFEFDQWIPNATGYPGDFKFTDSYNFAWYGQTASVNGRFITVTFNNFNNASSPITAIVLAGHLNNGLVDLTESSKQFIPTGLVPYYVEPPIPQTITNEQDWEA